MKSAALALIALVCLLPGGRAMALDRCDEDDLTGVRRQPGQTAPTETRSPWKDAVSLTGAEAESPQRLSADPRRPLIVHDAKWARQDFSGLRLSGICFVDSDLSGSVWTNAVTSDLAFLQVDLSGADLVHGQFHRALFLNDKLDHARAARADLTGAAVAGGSFDGLDLKRSDLTDFLFLCGIIVGEYECEWPKDRVDAREARMTRTRLDLFLTGRVVGPGWTFDGARLDGAVVQYRQIPQFRRAIAVSPVILEASGYSHDRVMLSVADWKAIIAAWDAGPPHGGRTRDEPPAMRPSPPPWLRPGVEAVYVNSDPPAPRAFRTSPTYRRILPVIMASSSSTLWLKAVDSAHIEALAEAEGGNGHQCSVAVATFTFEPRTGWFGASRRADAEALDRWEDVIRLHGDQADVGPDVDSDYISCGARAGFEPMTMLPLRLTHGAWRKAITDPNAP